MAEDRRRVRDRRSVGLRFYLARRPSSVYCALLSHQSPANRGQRCGGACICLNIYMIYTYIYVYICIPIYIIYIHIYIRGIEVRASQNAIIIIKIG
jgi:hypothetical protein